MSFGAALHVCVPIAAPSCNHRISLCPMQFTYTYFGFHLASIMATETIPVSVIIWYAIIGGTL